MAVTLEQIEILKQRANLTYAEAKEILEKYNGDVLEALINLENEARLSPPPKAEKESEDWATSKKILKTVKRWIKKGNENKFVVKKEGSTVVDLPINALIITTVVMPPLTVAGVLVAFVTDHKISFVKPDGEGMKINKTFDKVSDCVKSVSNKVNETINEN